MAAALIYGDLSGRVKDGRARVRDARANAIAGQFRDKRDPGSIRGASLRMSPS